LQNYGVKMEGISWFIAGLALGVFGAAWLAYQLGAGTSYPLHEEFNDGP